MPELKQIALVDIDEPELPARVAMDDGKLAELMHDMQVNGLLQPIGLKVSGPRFEIEYGHRRFISARNLGWHAVLSLVYQPGEIKEGAAMLAENIRREELSAAEEALLFAQAQEKYNLDEAGLCERFAVTADYLGDRLRLLRGDDRIFQSLLARLINFSVARELNKCEDAPHRAYLLDIAVRTGYSARVIADYVRQWRASLPQAAPNTPALTPAPEPTIAEPFRVECALCGGGKDPWNLVDVRLHKWEWEMIQREIQKSKGEE